MWEVMKQTGERDETSFCASDERRIVARWRRVLRIEVLRDRRGILIEMVNEHLSTNAYADTVDSSGVVSSVVESVNQAELGESEESAVLRCVNAVPFESVDLHFTEKVVGEVACVIKHGVDSTTCRLTGRQYPWDKF